MNFEKQRLPGQAIDGVAPQSLPNKTSGRSRKLSSTSRDHHGQIVPPPRHYSFNFGGSVRQRSVVGSEEFSDLDLSPESAYSPPDFTPMDREDPLTKMFKIGTEIKIKILESIFEILIHE